MSNITIIGSGSFGCALAYILSKNKDNNIKIWSFKKEESDLINNEHKSIYLKDLILDEKIKCYTNYEEALNNSNYIILVTPSKVIRQTCKDIKQYLTNQEIIIASKGLEENTNKILSDIVKEELNKNVSIISGPSHAEQIIKDIPTIVEYSGNKDIKNILETDKFKLRYTDDMIGMQVGAALKNVISIASGIIEGLGYETNTLAYVITEGLYEIKEIGTKTGAKESTFYNLSGLGDLLTTSLGDNSRNKKAGILLSQGKTKEEIQKEIGMIIEGFDNINKAYLLMNKYNLDLKLIKNLYKLLNNEIQVTKFFNNIIE